jgi:hypothetical protein
VAGRMRMLTRVRSCANTALVDRVDLVTPAIAVLSTGYRPLGSAPAQRAGAQRLCAMAQMRSPAMSVVLPQLYEDPK